MSVNPLRAVVGHLRRLADGQEVSDRQLLRRFAAHRDEAAFAALVRRHGPLVLGVCRRVLGHAQDAEDAFQAAFLTLARKAGTTVWGDSVAPWLYEVAWRSAAEVRDREARRRLRESEAHRPAADPAEAERRERAAVLHEELARLPEEHRAPLVLCHLQGRGRAEAARLLGLSLRTLDRRLADGREALRARLVRRGLPALPCPAPAALPEGLAAATAQAAGAAWRAAGLSAVFVKGAVMVRLKTTAVLLLALGVGGPGAPLGEDGGSARAAPAPTGVGAHFRRVNPAWVVEEYLLKPGGFEAWEVVRLKDRDPAFKGYYLGRRYSEKPGGKARKILTYYPSGRLMSEIDDTGGEQHSRTFHPGGALESYVYWRAGKWLRGFSVSPDGKVRHRLEGGRGELVTYGPGAGDRRHCWYHGGSPYLDKHFRGGKLARVRLNRGDDWLVVLPQYETMLLQSSKECWARPVGEPATVQRLDEALEGEGLRWGRAPAAPPPARYAQRRAEFFAGYAKGLKAAGRTFKELEIDFIRRNSPWPGGRR